MRFTYLVVEGPHDVEFVGRLLKPHQFKRVNQDARVDPYWRPLIPKTFPYDGDLSRRVPVPTFFASDVASVAVQAADGDTRILKLVEETLATLRAAPDAVGVVLDADSQITPTERFRRVREGLDQLRLGLQLSEQPGGVSTATPSCGIFVLPDNQTPGTLEDLLLECAAISYPGLLAGAQALVSSVQPTDTSLTQEDMESFQKPAGPKKATVACVAGILKPGRAIQVSIQDNRWLDASTLSLPRIHEVQRFLKELLALP